MSDENSVIDTSGEAIDNSSDDLDWDSLSGDDSPSDAEVPESEEAISADPEDGGSEEGAKAEPAKEKEEAVSEEPAPEKSEPEIYEVKVDGEVQKVTLEELKNNYSGKVAYDKKFSKLDGERKALEKQISDINSYVNELGKTMKNSSMLEGVFKIGELNNIGPHQITQALIKELLPEINRRMDLSEDQVELEYNRADLEYNRKLQEKQTADFEQRQSTMELQSRIGKVMDSLGADNEEWNDAVDFLDKNLPRSEELTPERVGEYIEYKRAESRTISELESFENGAFAKNQDVFNSLLEVIHTHPTFTSQDLQELLNEVYGASKQEVAEQEVNRMADRKSAKSAKKEINEEVPQFAPLESDDWDDIL